MAKNSRIHGSIFAEEIALRVHLLELFDGSLSRRCRAMVFAVSRIDGLIGTLKRGPDLLAPLDAYLFRIIETPRVGGTTAYSPRLRCYRSALSHFWTTLLVLPAKHSVRRPVCAPIVGAYGSS
jgi:hypothetical protein